MLAATTMTKTIRVVIKVSLRVGHVTLRPSSRTCCRNSNGPTRLGAGREGGVGAPAPPPRGAGVPRDALRPRSTFLVASFDAMSDVPSPLETNRGAKPGPSQACAAALSDLGWRCV